MCDQMKQAPMPPAFALFILLLLVSWMQVDECWADWPFVTSGEHGSAQQGGLTIADLDADGSSEVIVFAEGGFGAGGSHLFVLRSTGKLYSDNWPVTIPERIKSVSVGDVTGDGKKEIVVDTKTYWGSSEKQIVSRNGELLNVIQIAGSSTSSLLADIDSDGALDLVFTAAHASNPHLERVLALDFQGNTLLESEDLDGPCCGRILSVADLDQDGRIEIVGTRFFANGIFIVNGDGSVDYISTNIQPHSVTLADLDGDGDVAIVIHGVNTAIRRTFVSVYDRHGTLLWERETLNELGSANQREVAIANLDGDRELEVLFYNHDSVLVDGGDPGNPSDYERIYKLFAFNHDGTNVEGRWPIDVPATGSETYVIFPVVADINGDGLSEVLLNGLAGPLGSPIVTAWNHEGLQVTVFPAQGHLPFPFINSGTIAVGDLNNDGLVEMIWLLSGSIWEPGFSVDLMELGEGTTEWPMYHHDAQHTGRYGAQNVVADCNGNGVPDDVDIANGTSHDRFFPFGVGDGIPDECQIIRARLHRK